MMKGIYNRLIGYAYLVHLSTHQYEKMMIGKDDTGQKRNTYFSFGKSGDETMMSK